MDAFFSLWRRWCSDLPGADLALDLPVVVRHGHEGADAVLKWLLRDRSSIHLTELRKLSDEIASVNNLLKLRPLSFQALAPRGGDVAERWDVAADAAAFAEYQCSKSRCAGIPIHTISAIIDRCRQSNDPRMSAFLLYLEYVAEVFPRASNHDDKVLCQEGIFGQAPTPNHRQNRLEVGTTASGQTTLTLFEEHVKTVWYNDKVTVRGSRVVVLSQYLTNGLVAHYQHELGALARWRMESLELPSLASGFVESGSCGHTNREIMVILNALGLSDEVAAVAGAGNGMNYMRHAGQSEAAALARELGGWEGRRVMVRVNLKLDHSAETGLHSYTHPVHDYSGERCVAMERLVAE